MKHSSLTILLAILISLVGVKAFAYEFEIDGIYYKSNRTGMTVTSGPEKYSGSIVIPATITFNGITLSVTTIGDGAFEFCSDLTSITLPNSVTSIETGAFAGCSELTSIIIPESVTSIGTSAFSGCTGLTSIIIPESVTSIGSGAFSSCSGLTAITIPESIKKIEDYSFDGCTGLTSITLPNSVLSIGTFAFRYCSELASISIPESVASIKDYAFLGCTSLTSICIPESVTSIDYYAFLGCTSLTSITSLITELFPINIIFESESDDLYGKATLYVPKGTIEAYRSTDGWKLFENIVEVDFELAAKRDEFKMMLDELSGKIQIAKDARSSIDDNKPLVSDLNPITSPCSDKTEGQHIEYLWDGDGNTFWHSSWHGEYQIEPHHFFQVEVTDPEAYASAVFKFVRRKTSGNQINKWSIWGSNQSWDDELDDNNMPVILQGSEGLEKLADITTPYHVGNYAEVHISDIFETKGYKYLRFYVEGTCNSDGSQGSNSKYMHLSEFQVYPGQIYQSPTSQYNVMGNTAKNVEDLLEEFADYDYQYFNVQDYNRLKSAYDAFVEIFVDPTDLREAIAAYENKNSDVVVGTDPGFWPAGSTADIESTLTAAKTYDAAGAYTSDQSAAFIAQMADQAAAIDAAPIKIQEGKWYRFRFGTEAEYDQYGWNKAGNTATYILDKEDPEYPETLGINNDALFGKYLAVAKRVNNYDEYYGTLIGHSIVSIAKEEIMLNNSIYGISLDDLQDKEMSLWRFVKIGEAGYVIQNKATGLFIHHDAYLSVQPGLFTQHPSGFGQNAFFNKTIQGSDKAPLHLAQSGNVLCAWGNNTDTGWTDADGRRGSFFVEEVEDVAPDYTFGDFQMNLKPGDIDGWCFPVPVTLKNPDSMELWSIANLERNDEGSTNENVKVTFSQIDSEVPAGCPFFIVAKGDMPEDDEEYEPVIAKFGFTLNLVTEPQTDSYLKGCFDNMKIPERFLTTGSGKGENSLIWKAADQTVNVNKVYATDIAENAETFGSNATLEFVLSEGQPGKTWQDPETKINYLTTSKTQACVISSPDAWGDISILSKITIDGAIYSVKSIGEDAFYDCMRWISITIPEGVTRIGDYAFRQCWGLRSLTLPESLTNIGREAFKSCDDLTSITIPQKVSSIGEYAFEYCSRLTSIVVEKGNTKYDSRNDCNAIIETATNCLIVGCKNTIIPTGVTSIGDGAFQYCRELTAITIPEGVKSIGNRAFEECIRLTSISIPKSVTSIGDGAFWWCLDLTSITIPESVTSIGRRVFAGNNMTSIIVEKGNTMYDSRGDWNAIIETTTNSLIAGCKNTIFPSDVTNIGYGAFYSCEFLSITIPESVTKIGEQAFLGCDSLTSITIPESVTSICDSVFFSCRYLTSITSLIKEPYPIDYSVFNAWPMFTNMYETATLYVPAGTVEAYKSTEGWKNFKNIVELKEHINAVIGSSGVATLCADIDLDFSEVNGLKAYIASGFNPTTGVLVLTRVTEVPAGEGLYITGDEGTYEIPCKDTNMFYSNLLKGTTSTLTISPTDGDKTNFILAKGEHGVAFYSLSKTGELAAGKAYLQLPTESVSNVKSIHVLFDDEETGVQSTRHESETTDFFNMQGQRISHPKRGLFITKGKKVIIH